MYYLPGVVARRLPRASDLEVGVPGTRRDDRAGGETHLHAELDHDHAGREIPQRAQDHFSRGAHDPRDLVEPLPGLDHQTVTPSGGATEATLPHRLVDLDDNRVSVT